MDYYTILGNDVMPCYNGYVDTLNGFEIFGWAINEDCHSEKVYVDLVVDGTIVETRKASTFRQDLKELGISDGFSGFHFSPYNLLPEYECHVCVLYSGTDIPIPNGEKRFKKANYNFATSKTDCALQIKNQIEKNAERIDLHYSRNQYAGLLEINIPCELYVGKGLTCYCAGWIFNPFYAVENIEIAVGSERYFVKNRNEPRYDVYNYFIRQNRIYRDNKNVIYSGYSEYVELPSNLMGRTERVVFTATFTNKHKQVIWEKTVTFLTAESYYQPVVINDVAEGLTNYSDLLVAVCMATYQPDIEPFKRQIDSIRAQSFQDWICIISDDGSDKETLTQIEATINNDRRFFLIKNKKNVGFYNNFENVLRHVPANVQYVALCDQDDYWYHDKLEKLIKTIKSNSEFCLVYSDMKIVEEKGAILSGTYWSNRRNYYKDLSIMLIANTVTGAACMFRRDLIEFALPFPQKHGNSFHDHVLACCALLTGKIGYIDEPLYDYIQYKSGVIGHCDFKIKKVGLLRSIITNLFNRNYYRVAVNYFIETYNADYIRLNLLSRVLRLRTTKTNKNLNIFTDRIDSVLKLLLLHIKVKLLRYTTDDAELKMAFSYIAKKYLSKYNMPDC